jgi:hypothetical protein
MNRSGKGKTNYSEPDEEIIGNRYLFVKLKMVLHNSVSAGINNSEKNYA